MTTETREAADPAQRAIGAWQDGLNAMLGGFGRQSSQIASGFWGVRMDPAQVSEALRRIMDGTRDVAEAQFDVAREWLQAPLWLTGASSPSNLQASFGRLTEAYGRLFAAYASAATPAQNAALESAERATETTRNVIETQVRTAREVTKDVAEAQQATAEANAQAARRATRATARAVEQAIEVAEEATERAETATRRATARMTEAVETPKNGAAAKPAAAPAPIKGHVSRDGEKIYHIPGQSSYERTQADVTFTTEEEARAAGYRRAETPGGGRIKGNVSRDGEKIYHVPGQANYDRIDAEALFETEEEALAAGFRPSLR